MASYLTCGVNSPFSHVRKDKFFCVIRHSHTWILTVLGFHKKLVIRVGVESTPAVYDSKDYWGLDPICAPSNSEGCLSLTLLTKFVYPVPVILRRFPHRQIQVLSSFGSREKTAPRCAYRKVLLCVTLPKQCWNGDGYRAFNEKEVKHGYVRAGCRSDNYSARNVENWNEGNPRDGDDGAVSFENAPTLVQV